MTLNGFRYKIYLLICRKTHILFRDGKDPYMKSENQEPNINESEHIPFEGADEQPEAPRPGPDAEAASVDDNTPKKKTRSLPVLALSCAVIFTALYALINIQVLSGIFSSILKVFAPIILGGALAYLLNPILKFYEYKVFKKIKSKNFLRTLSLIMTYITMILIVAAFLLLLIPQLIDSITTLASDFDSHVENVAKTINNFANKLMQNEQYRNLIDADKLVSSVTNFLFKSEDVFSAVITAVSKYGMGLIIGIKNIVLAIFISIYVLISKERLKAQTAKFATAVLSPSKSRRFFKYVSLCDRTFGGFFVGKIIDSLIIGVISLAVFAVFRIPYFFLISAIICITNVIPVFGPFLGAIPSFFIILIVDPKKAILFLVLILLIQQLDGNVIGPKILGNTTGISSLGVIISIIIMGEYFGIIGMLVGVPIFAVGISIVKEFLETRLRAKNKPTDTAEYYAIDSLVDPHEHHVSVSARIFESIGATFKRIFKKKKKKEDAPEKPSDSDK